MHVGDGDLEVILDAVVDRFLDAVGLEVEGEPVGGLLGLGVDEVVGTVPSAEGVVVVVSDEMPDELMVSASSLRSFIGRLRIFWPIRMFYEMGGYIF